MSRPNIHSFFRSISTTGMASTGIITKKDIWGWMRSIRNRAIGGAALLVLLYLLYRAVWLTSWYWPYLLLRNYFSEQMPTTAPWLISTTAMLLTLLLFAQSAALLSFILFGKHKREMLILSLAAAVIHGGLGWYGHSRIAVDENGKIKIRVVESPEGGLRVTDHGFDPVTGRRARWATEADLVMLELQRRGLEVSQVGRQGPFRSPQGTINVFYTKRDGKILLYTGPRHRDVTGDMLPATDEILGEYFRQQQKM